MKILASIMLALSFGLSALGQTKINLGTQVQGQLPVPNGANVLLATPQVNTGSGVHRGANATTGYTETFVAEGRCVPGTANAVGFESSTNLDCSLPGFYHATSGTFALYRTFAYGVTNAQPPAPNHLALTASSTWSTSTVGSIGVSTCAVGTFGCSAANELGITWNSSGLYLLREGTSVLLWGSNGNSSGNPGTTDSTTGAGWAAPSLGAIYSFSMALPGDGTVIVSAMPAGSAAGNPCFPSGCSFAVRIPVTLPNGSFHSLFVRGGTADYISDVSVVDGFTMVNQPTPVYDIASDPRLHAARVLRWAVTSAGAECNYTTIATTPNSDCTNVFALIPPNYNPNAANPWWLQVRGEENSTVSFYGTFAGLNPTLFQAGLVGVFGDWHGTTYYGAPHDLQDLANAVAIVRTSLSLADRPHVLSDSAGGVVTANAITHGLLKPKTWQCYSCNLNLLSDAFGENVVNQQDGGGQLPFIAPDYGFSAAGAPAFGINAAYTQYTSGFDPLLVMQNPAQKFPNSIFDATYPLMPNAAYVLASIPLLAVADGEGGDTVVDPNLNTVAFCTADNAINPGICTLSNIGGGHVSSNKFVGSTALNWINSHP